VRKESFAALAPGFKFLRGLIDDFWDTLHPEIEDDDLEERAALLAWLGVKLEGPLRLLPIVSGGLSWSNYKESLALGTEADAKTQELRQRREQLIGEGKVSGEQWSEAVGATPKIGCEKLKATLAASLESLDRLGEVCDKRFPHDPPGFSKTRSAIEEISNLVRGFVLEKGGPTPVAVPPRPPEPVSEPAPVRQSAVVQQEVEAPEPISVVPAAGATLGIDPVDMADAERRISAICRYLRKNDSYDIAPFLILRGLRFGQIRYNGPHKIDQSMLEAPPSGLRAELKRLAAEQNWDDLLEATQRAMELPCGRAWLDVQRYTVLALEGKGEWWTFVADAVRTELRGLLSDLPGLLEMQLHDDTPTANPETKKWIEERVLSQLPSTAAAVPPAENVAPPNVPLLDNSEIDKSCDEVFHEALSKAGAGRLPEALNILTRQLASERSGRAQFLRRVQLAHMLMAADQSRVALPILDELALEIGNRSLETWEDRAALAYPLSLMLECLKASDASEADRAAVYARICRLDPARALSIGNS
jgi:type VI secretion system protein ImpA